MLHIFVLLLMIFGFQHMQAMESNANNINYVAPTTNDANNTVTFHNEDGTVSKLIPGKPKLPSIPEGSRSITSPQNSNQNFNLVAVLHKQAGHSRSTSAPIKIRLTSP